MSADGSMDFLLERFAQTPEAVAFLDRGRSFTYGRLVEAEAAFERRLRDEGVVAGEIAVVLGDYSPELFCLLLALLRNSNTIVPVTRESVVERETILSLSEAQWVIDFTSDEAQLSRTGVEPSSPLLLGLRETGDPGLILFSSGSTGRPKAILHDMRLVTEKFRKPGPRIVAIAFLMLDHFGGINTIFSILGGLGTVVTVRDRSVVSICRAIEEHHVEILPTTPSFLNLLVRSDALDRFDLGSLEKITYGTEVMPQQTLDRVGAAFPGVLLQQTYGLSELGVLRSKSREDGSLWVRVGGDGFQTKVVDGILWIKSGYAMVGYLNAPSPFDAGGWFNTQDLVEVEGEWLRILGRDSDLINIAGQKVYPAEVEQAILELDNIADVAVYGESNPLLGQIVVAKVATVEPETAAALKARIRRACAHTLAAFKLPTKVVVAGAEELYSVRLKKKRRA
jgi:acyl-CoA synthetase (AMP-forming)/AMP-acid ligase II